MDIPTPTPGLVVGYAYLWADEAERGMEEGLKDRPCALILALESKSGEVEVVAVPITHTPPVRPETAFELPTSTKQRLGLDDSRSWLVLNESNSFIWPGPDLRLISPQRATCTYGLLPTNLFTTIKRKFLELEAAGQIRVVLRPE